MWRCAQTHTLHKYVVCLNTYIAQIHWVSEFIHTLCQNIYIYQTLPSSVSKYIQYKLHVHCEACCGVGTLCVTICMLVIVVSSVLPLMSHIFHHHVIVCAILYSNIDLMICSRHCSGWWSCRKQIPHYLAHCVRYHYCAMKYNPCLHAVYLR